jgi:anthranilate synthase component I
MLEQSPKTYEDFLAAAKNGNVVPIVRSVFADLHTPVGAFLRVADLAEKAFLFESIEGGELLARYSFLAANPFMTVTAKNAKVYCEKDGKTNEIPDVKLFDFLRQHFEKNKLALRENLPPLCGGAVGFLAYETVRWFEPILDKGTNFNHDDAVWMFFRTILAFDRLKQRIEIISIVFTDEANGDAAKLRQLYDDSIAETERLEKLLNNPEFRPNLANEMPADSKSIFKPNQTKANFEKNVKAIQEKILNGDCYQVVLSQKFTRKISAREINIYRALRTTNPSPYMFFMKLGKETLIGASPEMLVRCRGKNLDYRPIAGTRKRGANEEEDWMLGEDMRTDIKEVSEHVMLVDLGRNDLGRVAEYGTVEIDDLMKIEKYSHVQHLVTGLRAKLDDKYDRFDALSSCFPAGTVSGAPKVKAMQLIEELEPESRGVYAGTVGYIDYANNLDTCIAIRTIKIRDGIAAIQAGAGIVHDSVPEKEYEETINKARALVKAIELAEKGI